MATLIFAAILGTVASDLVCSELSFYLVWVIWLVRRVIVGVEALDFCDLGDLGGVKHETDLFVECLVPVSLFVCFVL